MLAMKRGVFAKIIFLSVFLLVTRSDGYGQWILQGGLIDEQIHRGIELTYNMNYGQADRTFDSVIAENSAHPSGYFYKAMVNFWRAVTNTDNTGYDEAYRQ